MATSLATLLREMIRVGRRARDARGPGLGRALLHRRAGPGPSPRHGRDVGSIVLPNSDLKIFLTVRRAVRAGRRLAERGEPDPGPGALAAETERLVEGDRRDSERAVTSSGRPSAAIPVGTTNLSFDQQVARIVALVSRRIRSR